MSGAGTKLVGSSPSEPNSPSPSGGIGRVISGVDLLFGIPPPRHCRHDKLCDVALINAIRYVWKTMSLISADRDQRSVRHKCDSQVFAYACEFFEATAKLLPRCEKGHIPTVVAAMVNGCLSV